MLIHFFAAFGSAWFCTEPLQPPRATTMQGQAIVKLCHAPYNTKHYSQPNVGDTVLVNMPNCSDLQWAVILEIMPDIKGGCKMF